jgi:hypothetical protein
VGSGCVDSGWVVLEGMVLGAVWERGSSVCLSGVHKTGDSTSRSYGLDGKRYISHLPIDMVDFLFGYIKVFHLHRASTRGQQYIIFDRISTGYP